MSDSGSDIEPLRPPRKPPKYVREISARLEELQRDMESLREACGVLWDLMQSKASSEDLQSCHALVSGKVSHEQLQEFMADKASDSELQGMLSGKVDAEAFEQLEIDMRIRLANVSALLDERAEQGDIEALQAQLDAKVNGEDLLSMQEAVNKLLENSRADPCAAFRDLDGLGTAVGNKVDSKDLPNMQEALHMPGEERPAPLHLVLRDIDALRAQVNSKAGSDSLQTLQEHMQALRSELNFWVGNMSLQASDGFEQS